MLFLGFPELFSYKKGEKASELVIKVSNLKQEFYVANGWKIFHSDKSIKVIY